jgi:hypothetical protein
MAIIRGQKSDGSYWHLHFVHGGKVFQKNMLRRFFNPLHWRVKSKLTTYLGKIVEWRRRGLSYRACSEELARLGVITGPSNVHRWLRSQRRRALRISRELDPFNVLPGKAGGEVKPMPEGTRFELQDYEGEITK